MIEKYKRFSNFYPSSTKPTLCCAYSCIYFLLLSLVPGQILIFSIPWLVYSRIFFHIKNDWYNFVMINEKLDSRNMSRASLDEGFYFLFFYFFCLVYRDYLMLGKDKMAEHLSDPNRYCTKFITKLGLCWCYTVVGGTSITRRRDASEWRRRLWIFPRREYIQGVQPATEIRIYLCICTYILWIYVLITVCTSTRSVKTAWTVDNTKCR